MVSYAEHSASSEHLRSGLEAMPSYYLYRKRVIQATSKMWKENTSDNKAVGTEKTVVDS